MIVRVFLSKSHMKGMSDISLKIAESIEMAKSYSCRIPMAGLYEERFVIMKLKSSPVLTFYPVSIN